MTDTVKRTYDSALRREQAAVTQQRVLAAARQLLLERGYAATTMVDIAAAAGVAVQTVYSTGGGKGALAKWVYDVTLAGDTEPVSLADRPDMRALFADPDPRAKVARYARLSRQIYTRLGAIARVLRAGAAAGDHDLQTLVATTARERLVGTARLANHLAQAGALRPGLTVERAGHRLWALTAPELADGLTLECGWTLDELEAWLDDAMAHALLGCAPTNSLDD